MRWKFMVLLLLSAANGSAQFVAPIVFPPVSFLRGVGIGRILGGPAPDIVTLAQNQPPNGVVTIYVDQNPLPAAAVSITCLPYPTDLEVGDVDGDGDSDVVVRAANGLSIIRSSPTGLSRSDQMTGSAYLEIHLADIDTDGDLDVWSGADVALNDGFGNFGPTWLPRGIVALSDDTVAHADFDGDGDADAVAAGGANAAPSFYANDGLGTFGAPVVLGAGTAPISVLCSADLDGDARRDFVAMCNNGAVFAYYAVASPALFSAPVPIFTSVQGASPVTVRMLRSLDYDSDARDDILVQVSPVFGGSGGDVTLLLNAGIGSFAAAPLPSAGNVQATATGDLDADGDDDYAAKFGSASVYSCVVGFSPTFSGPAYILDVVSGDDAPCGVLQATAQPLVVEVRDASTGAPVPGIDIRVDPIGGVLLSPSGIVTSDATGRIAVLPTGGSHLGRFPLRVRTPGAAAVTAHVRVLPAVSLAILSGGDQATTVGQSLLQPIVVRSQSPYGVPVPGVLVGVAVVDAAGSATSSFGPAPTDSQGLISYLPPPNPNFGTYTVTFTAPALPSSVVTHYFQRAILVVHAPSTASLVLVYRHERSGVPILIAADLPQPLTPTPYGSIATSILNPQPTLGWIDGLGLFGPPNPSAVTAPNWSFATTIPPSVYGLALVAQSYAIDVAYPFPASLIVGNFVNFVL